MEKVWDWLKGSMLLGLPNWAWVLGGVVVVMVLM
jgi:hypothetical protein